MNDEEVSQTFIYIYQNVSVDHTTISKAEKKENKLSRRNLVVKSNTNPEFK